MARCGSTRRKGRGRSARDPAEMRPPLGAARGLRGDGLPARHRHRRERRGIRSTAATISRPSRFPWVWVIPPEVQARGAHLIIARRRAIADDSVDPTVKNFHWGDLTRAPVRGARPRRRQPRPARSRRQRHRRAGLQRLRGDRRRAWSRRIAASLEGITRRSVFGALRRAGIPLRSPAAAGRGAARGRRDLPRHHRRRDHAGVAPRRPHSRQRPARAGVGAAARDVLGQARRRLARDAGRLRAVRAGPTAN